MRDRIILLLFTLITLCSCKEDKGDLFLSHCLQDSLDVYITSIKDIPKVSNRMTTCINIFNYNDSCIVVFDSQPELIRSLIPGYTCGDNEVFVGRGFYKNRYCLVYAEPQYERLINKSALLPESEEHESIATFEDSYKVPYSDSGWHNSRYFRRYYLKGRGEIELLESENPSFLSKLRISDEWILYGQNDKLSVFLNAQGKGPDEFWIKLDDDTKEEVYRVDSNYSVLERNEVEDEDGFILTDLVRIKDDKYRSVINRTGNGLSVKWKKDTIELANLQISNEILASYLPATEDHTNYSIHNFSYEGHCEDTLILELWYGILDTDIVYDYLIFIGPEHIRYIPLASSLDSY